MTNLIVAKPIISLPEMLRSKEPVAVFKSRLIELLARHLKKLKIVWSPESFRGGIENPELPLWLLKKLDSLIGLAEAVDWRVSKALKDELDSTIEDVETFNPPFRKSLKRASAGIKAGKFATQGELEGQYGLKT